MTRNNWMLGLLAVLVSIAPICAEDVITPEIETTGGGIDAPMIEAVDIPTADVLDAATFATTFRFYSEGGLVSRLLIGPFRRVNLGISFDAQHVIGGGEPDATTPDVFFKLRFFDGTDILPALALGYDSQGYIFQQPQKRFLHEEKGMYLVGSHEFLLPDMELHAGMNVPQLDKDAKLYGFFGMSWRFVPAFALMTEYDNIRNGPGNRFNAGGRFFITPFFNVDVAARNISRKSDRGAERIVRLNYVARFPF